jgi:hypothetical protein
MPASARHVLNAPNAKRLPCSTDSARLASRSEGKRSIILAADATVPGMLQIVLNTLSACGNMTVAISQIPAE